MIDYKNFPDYDNHELVVELDNPSAGLKGFIVVHNSKLGSALGGTRMFPYSTKEEALRDALRLSRAMTYKCAIAGLPYGGGKGVIIADPNLEKTQDLLKAYANEVSKLEGRFHTGEDVGLFEPDVQFMLQYSPFMVGKRNQAGDPSVFASRSVMKCMEEAVLNVFASDIRGKTVAVRGLGKTGSGLVDLLIEKGAKVVGADKNDYAVKTVMAKHPNIRIVSPEEVYKFPADVYSPCALGDEITVENANEFTAKIICGTANNQLKTTEAGDMLYDRGIVFIPDYLGNAGGLINVADELEPGGYSRDRVLSRIDSLKEVCAKVLRLSKEENRPEYRVADEIAEQFINEHVKATA